MNGEKNSGELEDRAEAAMLVRAWAEGPNPSDVRALVTSIESDERRVVSSLEAMHSLIDEILIESNVINGSERDGQI